jgi:hypothetical protein
MGLVAAFRKWFAGGHSHAELRSIAGRATDSPIGATSAITGTHEAIVDTISVRAIGGDGERTVVLDLPLREPPSVRSAGSVAEVRAWLRKHQRGVLVRSIQAWIRRSSRSIGTLDEARALVARWVEHYNTVRLHSAIGYITPADRLADRGPAIWAQRDARLEAAREVRRLRRAKLHQEAA